MLFRSQLLRNELDELASTGKSMMPEGLEKDLSPQDVADVIAYVRSKRVNSPAMVRARADGVFVLLPGTARVSGPTIVIEPKYTNFGHWSSADDQVAWTVETKVRGVYDVWIYYACDTASAHNTLSVRAGMAHLAHKVAGTGSWDKYRGERIGALYLMGGTQEIVFRSVGKIRGALLDLKKVELSPR